MNKYQTSGMSLPALFNRLEKITELIDPEKASQYLQAFMSLYKTVSHVPTTAKCYLNHEAIVSYSFDAAEFNKNRVALIAQGFFDVQSALSTQLLLKYWRTEQLLVGLISALDAWNLSTSAVVARALVETAAAFSIESEEIIQVWRDVKKKRIESMKDIIEIRRTIYVSLMQMFWATRISKMLEVKRTVNLKRKNILTLVESVSRQSGEDILTHYEVLCDAVHPSWGANECFFQECGKAVDLPQTRIVLNKHALGKLGPKVEGQAVGSELPETIFTASLWAVKRLTEAFANYEKMCIDFCLTSKVYKLTTEPGFGVIKPSGAGEICVCKSGKKTAFCQHEFGQ